jgi:hypothetical protein
VTVLVESPASKLGGTFEKWLVHLSKQSESNKEYGSFPVVYASTETITDAKNFVPSSLNNPSGQTSSAPFNIADNVMPPRFAGGSKGGSKSKRVELPPSECTSLL